jgi:hypothetical protein
MKGTKMALTFKDNNVTITGSDANTLAGFAIIGIFATGFVCYKVGYKVGYHGLEFALNTRDRIKEQLKR